MGKILFTLFKQFGILDPEWVVRAYFPSPSVRLTGVKSKDKLIQAQLQSCHLVIKMQQFMLLALKSLLSIPFCWSSADYQPKQAVFGPQHAPFWEHTAGIASISKRWQCFNTDRNALLHMLWDCPNPWQKIKCQFLSNQRFRNSTCLF